MEPQTDIILTSSPLETDNDTTSINSNVYLNNVKEDPISKHVQNDNTRRYKKKNVDVNTENDIYNLMCPWDYLVNFSNVSFDTENGLMISSVCQQQLKSLVNNFELLVSQFKSLLET